MKKVSFCKKKIIASVLCANMLFMNLPASISASEISGFNQTSGTYNIEAAKVSGNTGFREYNKFELSQGDIANLIFKNGQKNFVNLVDNQITINGILNTMQGNNFYNGHAIFVSPQGMVIGSSGVLNIGSLTMMAPSQNAYNAFKNGLSADNYKNIANYKFDLANGNYKSLITNSSGTISIQGKIFAREGVEAYARTINISKATDANAPDPGIFAGIKNNDNILTSNEAAEALFNSLVSNNITSASDFNLEGGKIKLVTNKAQDEIITTVFTSEEAAGGNNSGEKKQYQTTTAINVANGLKTVEKKEITQDGKGQSTTEQTIDNTFENSSLSSEGSAISISDANIAANEVEIEANADLTKQVTEDSIKAYGEAVKKAEQNNNNNSNNTITQDSTSGYKIHKSSMGVAGEAEANVSISNTKIKADTISVKSNAQSSTESYIQLMAPLWENWIALFGQDALIRIMPKLLTKLDGENADMYTMIGDTIDQLPWSSKEALFSYFSDKMYKYFDGARANANIGILSSEIKGASSVDITSNADAALKLTTGNLDSHALLMYGLGSGTESKVTVTASTISALNGVYNAQTNSGDEVGTGNVNINAFSTIDHSIDYDSSNFKTIIDNNGSTTGNTSGYNFSLLNNSISSNNNVTIDTGSTIEAANVDVKAIGFNKSDIKIQNVSNVGENAERSGISASMLINHTDTKADVAVNGSTVKANYRPAVNGQEVDLENTTDENNPVMKAVTYEYGNARFIAENIESIQNKITTKVQAKQQDYSINTREMSNFDPSYTIKLYDWLNKKFLNKASDKVGALIDKAHLEFSGSAIWNDEINEASSILNGATVNVDNLSVNSNILDFNTNAAVADAAANSKLGGGAAIIVNGRNNTNLAEIIGNSTITAATTVSVDAQTQLPMNPLTLKVGPKSDNGNMDYYIGASFDEGDGTDKWDTEFIHSDLMKLLGVIGKNANKQGFQKFLKAVKSPKKTIGSLDFAMDGLLNNYAKAQTGGQYSGIAGSVVVDSISNNTTAKIDSSNVTATNGDVLVNAVNSVVNNDGAGKVEFMITEINDFLSSLKNGTPEQQLEASKFGMGGSVLVQNFTNNATATINKSKVTAENGNLDVLSASEEGYINIAVAGAKAQNVAIEGSVSVQNIKGTTKASIEDEENNTNLIEAKNVNVKAGSAKARTKAKTKGSALLGVAGESIVVNPDTHELVRNEARESKDGVLNITIFGTNAMNSGTGVSVGASVDVSKNSKQVNSLVDKAKITADENINVIASSYNKKIDVLASGAFTSGVQTSNLPNVGNSQDGGSTQDIINDSNGSTNESLENNQTVLDGNNPNSEGAAETNSEGQTSGESQLAQGVANILTGDDTSSSRNFSASLAGTVEVFNDKSIVTTAINNAVLNVGNELNVTADKDNFLLNVSGGVAKGDTIGGGAAVNIYSNKGTVSADITGGTITFNSNNAKKLNVTATSNHFITDVAMGVGIAGDDSSFGAAVGGSFNTNTLKDTTSAKMTGVTVSKKSGAANDIDVNVAANTESKIYNVAGEVGYSNSEKVALGAGVAGNMDVLEQAVLAQITGKSTLDDAKDVIVDSVLKQHIHSTSVAGEVVSSDTFGFNIGGAIGLELIKNNVSAAILGIDSDNLTTISSSGDVRVKADSVIDGFTATGALNATVSKFSVGAGIGAIVDIDSSEITAQVDNAKVEKSKSIEVKANSSDKRDFVAANLGGQLSETGSFGITANGIVSVLKSKIHAQVLNGSQLATDGTLNINSSYINNFKGITGVGEGAKKGGAIGANVLVNHFENDVLSEISNNSTLTAGNDIGISAKTEATLNLIPAAVSIAASGITALAADVSVDIIKDKTQALANGDMTSTNGNITVGADDETTLLNRGGTLAASSPRAGVDISGAVNVDKIAKTVKAQIGNNDENANKSVVKAENGTVSVSSVSTTSIGGTKNAQGLYDRDDITSEAYQNALLTKDSEGHFNGINYTNGFGNWNMFYNLAAGSQVTIPGTVVIKTIQNNVNAEVLNTELTAKNMNMTATDYSVKNIVSGEISGSKFAAIGAQVYITKDNSTTSSIIGKNSDITVANTLNITAWNRKDNKVVFAAAGGAGKVAAKTNVLKNTINDDTIAKIETGIKTDEQDTVIKRVTAGTLNISSEEDVNASRIVVAASGSANAAIDVSPLINYYGDTSTAENRHGKTVSEISNSTINNAVIGMNADTNIRTQDIAIDAGGAGTGFAGSGTAIKNTYNTITKAIIDKNSTVNNAQDIKMNANSVFDSNNYAIGASGLGVGANLIANVILNDFISKTEASITDSTVSAKSIELNTNKGKKDNLVNYGIAGGFAAKGVSAVVTTIYDVFNNESISKVVNSNITTDNGGLKLDANSQRTMKNYDISASLAGLGFGGAASALVTKNDSKTQSYIDAKTGNNINIAGQLYLNAADSTIANNTLGVGGGGLVSGIACVNLYTANNLVKSEILSQTGASAIKSGSAYVGAESTNAIRNLAVGAAAGLVSLAADVQLIKIGKFGSTYTETEQESHINDAIKETKKGYDKIATDEEKARYNPEADTTQSKTGVIANINANMENTGALEMKAKSNIKGVDKNGNLTDTLDLTNVDVSVGGTAPNAAVKNLKVANDTTATISGGNVTSGDISINAESNSNVEISSTGVTVSAVALSGGSSIYKNNSNTLAQIGSDNGNTTINANNIRVNTKSTSKSNLVTRAVGVRVAGIAGVNILENIDNNSSLAKITGNTNITANGDLSTHSTINTDLKSRQNTVEVAGADIAAVFRNETNASTISKSVIEAVTGTIKSKNISLISDYGTMKVENKVDSTQVKGVNVVGHDKAIVKMNATFESGINAGSAIIDNSGTLKIETAKKLGSEDITATNTLDEVVATIANFFSGSFGDTQSTVTSNTYLVAGNNTTGSLTINSYLDSLAKTTTGVRKGGLISVNSAYAESTDTSTLNLFINGTNKITGSATINAIHNAAVSSDLEALNVGIGVQGQRARVSATQTSNTVATIAGDYSANDSDININTNRNSYISKTTKSGGAISVNDASSNNTLDGNSTLNVNITNASTDLNNKMTVKNTSTNTFDIKSSDSSGGVINISVVNDNTTLNTRTTTNINNANIKAKGDVSFEVANNTMIDDTGTSKGGGFIAVLDDTYKRTYTSGAYLNLTDSEIHANDINLHTHSDISARRKNEFDFKAGGGGFVAVNQLELRNWLNQTSAINLTNSKLYANNDAVLSVDTSSWFKVKSDTDAKGFVSVPKVWSYLDPTYNQTIALDNSSIIDAANNAVFNFNSNNTLSSKVSAYSAGFAGPPSAYSWLNLNINNTLDNRGKIHAGNLADINFMTKSYNDLANHINTENRAAVAKTYEDGNLLKRVINNLKVPGGAEIVSDKDIEVTYSGGRNNFDSNKTWRTISYAAFGIPIDSGYKTTHPVNNIVGNSLELNGLMKAGNGGSKKITIDKAGNIVADKTEGFTSSDYSLSGGQAVDGKTIKDQKIAQIQSKINKATSDKEEVTVEIENLENSINIKTNEKENVEKITADFNSLISGDYKLLNSKIPDGQESSEFYNFVINDLKAQITGSEEGKLSEAQYKALGDAYGKGISAIYEYNQAHKDSPKEYMSISDFLSGNTSLGLSDVQKNTVKTACDTMGRNNNGGMTTANGIFDTYIAFDGTKYAGVTNPTEADNVKTCDEVTGLSEKIVELTSDITTLTEMAQAYRTAKENLTTEINTLTAEKTAVENTNDSEFARSKDTSYSIVFDDIISKGASIKIDGTTNKHISGTGAFSVAGSGLQVDNYSTRSLVFNDIDLGSSTQSGLYIDGKNYQEFLNKEQAVNGTDRSAYAYMYPSGIISFIPLPYGEDYNTNFDAIGKTGVHYISNGANVNSGIVINNYYDTANPFASSQNIPNPTLASDITFNGKIATNGAFNVFNDSGSISLNNFNADNIKGAVGIVSTKGNVDFNSTGLLKLNSGNNIFAGNAVNIKANSVNSSANITAGYNKDLTLTITDDMLNNLAYDPVTGENILINLGNTPYTNAENNVKAIYKDGQIHLYNINNEVKGVDKSQRGKINVTTGGSVSIAQDNLKTYDKYQTIAVDNKTDKPLNVYNVTNATSDGGYYLNGNKVKDAQGYEKAATSITSTGKLILDGVIRNAIKYENGSISLDSSPNDSIITHDDQGNISLASEINDSTLLLRSNGAGLELKKQAKYVDSKGNTSSNSIYAAGLVALYNDDKAKSGGDEASSNMIVNGDIEAQGNVLIYQDTKGTLDVNSTIHQLKHTDDQKGYIAIANNNNGSGALTLHENTFLHNEQGDIVIANLSNSAVNIDGVLYAPAGNVYTYSNGGTVTDSATTVVSGDIEFYNEGDSSIIINGINATSNGNIIVENTQGNLEITENGSLLNFSETAKNIDIRNTASGDKLTIAGTVANYSGGNINVENNGTGNAEISGYIYNKDGSINIDNKKNDLSITGIIDTDNGNVTIQNEGKALNIGNVDTQNSENNKKAVISVENGNLVIENNGTDRSNMTISAEIYHNSIDNTKSGNITVTNGENAGAFSIRGTEISSQGTNTEINIVNNSSYNDNDENNFGLAIQDSSISQRDGKTSITNGLSGLALEGTTIENTEQGNISITNSQGLLYTDEKSNIINKNGEINIANVGGSEFDGILSLQGTIQNEVNKENMTANTRITNSGTAILLNADIENYGGITSVESSFGYIGFNSNILNTGGDITIKNTATDATTLAGYTIDGVGISGVMVNTGGDINISNSNGDLYIDKESYIYNTSLENSSHNTKITNTGHNLEFYGNIGSDDGNIEISNSNSATGALTVTGEVASDNGIITITNNSEHGMVIDSTANIQNQEGNTVITNTQGSAVIERGANIVNTQDGDITVSNSGDDLTIGGLIEHQGTGKINVDNTGTGALTIGETATLYATDGDMSITNSSANGAEISGTVLNKEGDITVSSTAGTLNLTNNSNITADKGSISISNTATDKGTTLAGQVTAKDGNITVGNAGDKLALSGSVTDEKGNILITNNGDNGTEFTSTSRVTNTNGDTTITNNEGDITVADGAEIKNTGSGNIKAENNGGEFTISGIIKRIGDAIGNIFVNNTGDAELEIASTGKVENSKGNIDIKNSNDGELNIVGLVHDNDGNIYVKNDDDGGINISGTVGSDKGTTTVENTSDDGILITTAGEIHNGDGDISVTNIGADGIDIQGLIKADKQNIIITNQDSDITIGEYASDNDNYINAVSNDVIITQTGGNIVNGIIENGVEHQNHDRGNVNSAYKTLISSNGDITFNVTDGDIGSYSNAEIPAGTSYDASTRDYTESINVQASGKVNANVENNGNGLINIRAKESDLNIGTIKTDGNIILTAADWKQADVRPVDKSDTEYFNGYSILNGRNDNNSNIIGKNISLITSGSLGSTGKQLIFEQDTLNGGSNVSLSAEAENGLHLVGRSNSDANVKADNIISKHGDVDLGFESDAEIEHITADKGLLITQKAQNLTIKEFGTSRSLSALNFNDMLLPHDDILFDGSSTESLIPKYVDIKVLDSIDNSDRGNSTLKIYTGYVRGNNGDNANYYPNGARLADITLMADNIYAMSDKMQTPTYSDRVDLGNTNLTYVIDGETRTAKGLNAYGEGSTLTLDILGVDRDIVGTAANRNSYNPQLSIENVPSKFQNNADEIPFYGNDYSAKNVVLSVNDYSNRDVNFDTLYTDNAYISTNKDNLNIDNAYVNNFAEIKNSNKTAVVDNEKIGLLKFADIQLYTKKTGSFNLGLNDTINMHTSAPTVYNNPTMLVNGYHSAWNFVNRGFKENKDLIENIKMTNDIEKNNYNEPQKRISERFDTTKDDDLVSNYEIYDISTTGVSVKNDKKLKRGKTTKITIKFDDVDITLDAKVVKVEGNKAGLEFIDMPQDVANKILYKYMQKADSMKSNLTSSLQ